MIGRRRKRVVTIRAKHQINEHSEVGDEVVSGEEDRSEQDDRQEDGSKDFVGGEDRSEEGCRQEVDGEEGCRQEVDGEEVDGEEGCRQEVDGEEVRRQDDQQIDVEEVVSVTVERTRRLGRAEKRSSGRRGTVQEVRGNRLESGQEP
jgi:hypothetical protein